VLTNNPPPRNVFREQPSSHCAAELTASAVLCCRAGYWVQLCCAWLHKGGAAGCVGQGTPRTNAGEGGQGLWALDSTAGLCCAETMECNRCYLQCTAMYTSELYADLKVQLLVFTGTYGALWCRQVYSYGEELVL
jgi:hypothetical protein